MIQAFPQVRTSVLVHDPCEERLTRLDHENVPRFGPNLNKNANIKIPTGRKNPAENYYHYHHDEEQRARNTYISRRSKWSPQ